MNWKLFREFFIRQKPNFSARVIDLEKWDEKEVLKYFIVVNDPEDNLLSPDVPRVECYTNYVFRCY